MAGYESVIKPAGQLKNPKNLKTNYKLQLVVMNGAILCRENMQLSIYSQVGIYFQNVLILRQGKHLRCIFCALLHKTSNTCILCNLTLAN